jgi:ATP-dependent exoDNAse (exonuclease V) beta subunit
VLVRAPAGSGKTTLLAERYLKLLAQVGEPGQVLAITFTEAAAAEMRNRVLDELRKVEPSEIAQSVLAHSERLGWKLLELPAQLRISTIDAFCRVLALQQPLVSGLGGGLDIAEHPSDLYRRAARRALEQIGKQDAALTVAIERLLLWRDNSWKEIEDLLVRMLEFRDRWMHEFVLDRDPDWDTLRAELERPFARANPCDATAGRYTDPEWEIVCASFRLLRHAAAQLQVVFADTGKVDFTEVAQIALSVLKGEDGQPSDATLAVADGIRHLLVDEFQDTSRRQHQLLASLIRAWPDREGRTCFVVGDPMQSIYGFRDADAELFPRVEQFGLEIQEDQPLRFESVQLAANFRSASALVQRLNEDFERIFAETDGSGVTFTRSLAARSELAHTGIHIANHREPCVQLHLDFSPLTQGNAPANRKDEVKREQKEVCEKQVQKVVAVVREHLLRIQQARTIGEKYRIAVLGRARKALAPIAAALRDEGIPFRAVELEELKERPEILDALALARALLNPLDRVAWLGVLRAPWCGLALAHLHLMVSADELELLTRPIPDLLRERAHLLGAEERRAVERVLSAYEFAQLQRAAQPTASTGSWLQLIWLRLGGAQCVDAAERANLDLLWSRIDTLPEGEQDLLGPAIDAALDKLNAQPDPASDAEHGVQLMTIHKSKGLEFEVVIVPELQAKAPPGGRELLSWLERGLAESDDPREVTEFLVAPLQPKGADRGDAKAFVDGARREREKQELRRLLYVAATRARNELHFFARPGYKICRDGSAELAESKNTLLATAWPAFGEEIRRRFDAWRAARIEEDVEPATVDSIAAGASEQENEAAMPALVRRLPALFENLATPSNTSLDESPLVGAGRLYERHQGGLISRALGQSVHLLLQELAQLFATRPKPAALAALDKLVPRIAAQIRATGIDAKQASRLAQQALELARKAAADPIGEWILAPHADAASEVRWTGVIDGSLRTVQVDRVFRAGDTPLNDVPPTTWWIIDYKTALEEDRVAELALPVLRRAFAPQIEAYGKVLRNLQDANMPIRAGLYYPRMALFDWWEL